MQPLVQSVYEKPDPLTLRIYASSRCEGELYLDDGKTYAYQHGEYLLMKLACQVNDEELNLQNNL